MKQALVLAIASFGWTAAAFAQSPNTSPSPGPHDPNPPMNAPDLRLPPPCASSPNLAANGGAVSPVAATATPSSGGHVTPVDSSGNVQCSSDTRPQSAELPGLAPGIQ
jgi:hypothetical protein